MSIHGDLTFTAFQLNFFEPGGEIGEHADRVRGVAVALSLIGVGRATISQMDYSGVLNVRTIMDVVPGDCMVMPAQVGDRGGVFDQAWHGVTNVTPFDSSSAGFRLSVGYVYGEEQSS